MEQRTFSAEELSKAFTENRERLLMLVRKSLNPILLRRFSYEDVLAEAYAAAAHRLDYFAANAEVPVYFKFRTILLQTLTDLERKHLKAESRDIYKEVDVPDRSDGENSNAPTWSRFAADVTSPASRVDRTERHHLLRTALAALPESDRQILTLRHFDGYGNGECAAILNIDPKAASIRYVRALERLQARLMELSCFRS